jgi:hypothetical protein
MSSDGLCATVVRLGHRVLDVSAGRPEPGRPGLALVVPPVVEQRLDAVRAVLAGASVVEVAAETGVVRPTHRWIGRYLSESVGGRTSLPTARTPMGISTSRPTTGSPFRRNI